MHKPRIGLDRFLRRDWLDQAALLARELGEEAALRDALNTRLATDIEGAESRDKTVIVLTRVWWRVPDVQHRWRDEALARVAQVDADERLGLHWGMLLLAFPLFQDVTAIVGRLLRLQGEVGLAQVKSRLAASWGNNVTLDYAIPRILKSYREWGILTAEDARSPHHVGQPVRLVDGNLGLWLLGAALAARGTETPLRDVLGLPELFPFTLSVSTADVLRAPQLQVDNQGHDPMVRLADWAG